MAYTTHAGRQQWLSSLFPELSNQAKRSSDTTLSLFTDAPAVAEVTSPLITTVRATTKASTPLPADAALETLESSDLAQTSQGAIFQKGVVISATPDVAMDSHQVLSDSLPGAATAAGSASMATSCGCRACSVLAVSNGDGAAAWDITNDQAPLVMNGLVTLGTGVNLSSVFQLHSNPTATKTIFLDFDGYAIDKTPWEKGGSLSLKSFYSTFDSTALTEIQRIWQRVAEDYAPFNVNVTTQDPGTESLRKLGTGDDRWGIRVAFTSNLNLLTGNPIIYAGGGGTAYYGSFNWQTDDVALVFNRGEYSAAETASHEVGHTLGLGHDGGVGTAYYAGHGGTGPTSWGTIMGAPFLGPDENLTQWSKGEYFGADYFQDDLAVITGSNGFGYAADDHGNSFATATALTGLSFSSFGVIERNTDIDMFRFETLAGQVSFNIVNASRAFIGSAGSYVTEYLTSRGPNLDIAATLYRADQSIVQTFNPADLTTASFSTYLDAGTYYLGIDGVGFGTPLASTPTGYTDYGSLGQYMVSGTLPSTSQPPPILQVLDPNGAVELLRDPNTDLVSVRSNGVTTAVRASGAQIKASQYNGWQILAAETVASNQNQILWKELSTGSLHTWSVDSSWNFISAGATVTPSSSAGLLLQQQFMVDANGTPLTSTTTLPLISLAVSPATVLENGAANLIYTFSRTGATTNPLAVSYSIGGTATNGSDYGLIPASVTFAAGSATATVTVDPTGDSDLEPDETVSLTLQPNAAYSIGTAGVVTGTILNDDAATPPPPTSTLQVLDPNGIVQLLRDTSTDLVSVQVNGVTTAVRVSGAQIKASQYNGWKILAAETVASNQNQILWKELSTGSLHTWSVDSSWNFISAGATVTPSSSAGLLLQQQFMVDANGTPLASAPLNAAPEVVDPIIGGGTSFAPAANDAFAYDRMVLAEARPEDLIFSSEPILALAELTSLGEIHLIAADPLTSPFPAAGFGATPTTPWLVATQPLL
ncbi:hypothetical protein KBZ33_14900 [Cyanobium sp. Cruz-8D1]|uniref:zinc-dependent metalloprotease family protein n=1 Tax=Cyanobium sp. Cruz-8D1 TaxID=2823711 RepID=UPI0021BCBE94|nr:Calx-beta domain-containing protein [Cyanobium sp. Cruz-8D1]MCP9867560.1 hypothetical protein [Cyanobium sp. Cruz-8D1]